jgi:hypothetical protein
VEFEALAVQHYSVQLLMDLVGMAEGVLVVPLSAEAAVPKLQLSSPVLEYGECYLGHPYSRTIELLNDSKLPARFEVLDQVGGWSRAGELQLEGARRAAAGWGRRKGQAQLDGGAYRLLFALPNGACRGVGRAGLAVPLSCPGSRPPAHRCLPHREVPHGSPNLQAPLTGPPRLCRRAPAGPRQQLPGQLQR